MIVPYTHTEVALTLVQTALDYSLVPASATTVRAAMDEANATGSVRAATRAATESFINIFLLPGKGVANAARAPFRDVAPVAKEGETVTRFAKLSAQVTRLDPRPVAKALVEGVRDSIRSIAAVAFSILFIGYTKFSAAGKAARAGEALVVKSFKGNNALVQELGDIDFNKGGNYEWSMALKEKQAARGEALVVNSFKGNNALVQELGDIDFNKGGNYEWDIAVKKAKEAKEKALCLKNDQFAEVLNQEKNTFLKNLQGVFDVFSDNAKTIDGNITQTTKELNAKIKPQVKGEDLRAAQLKNFKLSIEAAIAANLNHDQNKREAVLRDFHEATKAFL